MPVRRHLKAAQVLDKCLGVDLVGVRALSAFAAAVSPQMFDRGAVTPDRGHRGSQHMFMMVEPAGDEVVDRDRLEGERRAPARGQLGVDFGPGDFCLVKTWADALPPRHTAFAVIQPP